MPSQQLSVQQRQSLSMTPQLQQSIKLLQLPTIELAQYIEEQVMSNPLLEYDESSTHLSQSPLNGPTEHGQVKDRNAFDWAIDNAVDESANSFREHLFQQIAIDIPTKTDRYIACILVDYLDASGYFSRDSGEVANKIGCSSSDIERVLLQLKRLDPTGVFAKDIRECMAVQMQERNHYDPIVEQVLDHLDLVAQGDLAALTALCDVDVESVEEVITEIKQLNPKPSAGFNTEALTIRQADIRVSKTKDSGTYRVELIPDRLPKVLINTSYYQQVKQGVSQRDDRNYLSEQYQSANWLVRALNQRAETLLKVASEIVLQQSDFLDHGVFRLKPLRLQDISENLAVHESTVARVIANKFMETERGVFDLKYFFSSAIGQQDSAQRVSSTSVKEMIKTLIDKESAVHVLSDAVIADTLQEQGLDIARRTVAKYRESLQIPSSAERRKMKHLKH